MDEFKKTAAEEQSQPLAFRLRPHSLDGVVGQKHLLGPGRPLRILFEAHSVHSMILWGPPGVGKTTLAYMLARGASAEFLSISSVNSGVRDIRSAVDSARRSLDEHGRQTIFFIDEIHRFNKSQQDSLLPHVESGLLTLIGATTDNPSFEVVSALLSRCHVYVLHSLDEADLNELIARALKQYAPQLRLSEEAAAQLCHYANGDARRLLNALEYLIAAFASAHSEPVEIDDQQLRDCLPDLHRRYDKGGDEFYDQISALHKSVRGSDPDASLYWFCRMLDGGCDPRYLARRIVRMAWEDIGLSDPRAADLTLAAAATYERLGSPEGELALATAVIYLASTTKSNAAYTAFGAAKRFVAGDKNRSVPDHLRNAPTRLMKNLGYGRDYRYAHDHKDAYVAGESYFPKNMRAQQWYKPVPRGVEEKIGRRLRYLRELSRDAGKKSPRPDPNNSDGE
ncbi:MAG: replication-associated recombination protein A [Proteobacteria bacterium]|nr:replication-associated recombination protein A [Pseudomonadota bacterium]